jgi:hypothetical protein
MRGPIQAVDAGDYGPVLILAGAHQGQVGYYDDNDGQQAIVYMGEPFTSEYVLVQRDGVERVRTRSLDIERWKRTYPWLVKYLGVP